jgi:hypothetical protein
MTQAHNFRETTDHRTKYSDDTPPVSRVRRMVQALQRAHDDATYLNQRMLELPK